MHVCPHPAINSAHDGLYTAADLSPDFVTLFPAAVAAIVSPLDKEKRFAFILQFYTLFRCLCVLGKQPILCGRLKKAAVSIRLWQHFMLQNDKWRGRDRAGLQLKHTHTHARTYAHKHKWMAGVGGLSTACNTSCFQLLVSKILMDISAQITFSYSFV